MHKIFAKEEKYLSLTAVFIITAISAAVLTLLVFYLQFYNMNEIIFGLKTAGLSIFILNFLPVFLCMLLFLFLSGRLSVSFFITSFFSVAFAIINRTKIILRQDPLTPKDFNLGTEALTIVMKMEAKSVVIYSVTIIAVILFGAVLIIFIKNKRIGTLIRITGIIAVICISGALNNIVYSNEELYDNLPVESRYYLVSHYNTKGFIYCFIYQINEMGLLSRKTPESYKKSEILKVIEEDYPDTENLPESATHVIILMGEAFSDLSEKADLDFTNHRNPLLNFNKLKEEGISGEILVAHTGGGTADTEFDMLTGLSIREEESVSYAFRLISKPFESVASNLERAGYHNIFIHPGTGWFYNRRNVYELMGFKDLYFSEYFVNTPTKGGYINENDTIDAVINLFDDALKENPKKPIFEFCVNIQNHGPYDNKYSTWEMNFDTDVNLSDSEINILSNYFQGVIDQDENLGKLADYLNSLDEPVILLYFGDHIPSMPTSLLNNIGIDFDFGGDFYRRMELYKTPYLFWQNKEYIKRNGKLANPGYDSVISVNYLGASLLELMGYGDISSLNKFLNELKYDIPVITKDEYITKNGYKSFNDLTDLEKEKIMLYKQWQYYKLYDE